MVIVWPLLAAAALLASGVSASPLQADAEQLEARVPFCESRNPIVTSIRNSPQGPAFCSSFLSIGPRTTTRTVLRTVRTITTRPVSTTVRTSTVTSRPSAATVFSDQVSVIVTTPTSTQTSIITEPSVSVSTAVITETSTSFEPLVIFETSTSTEVTTLTETSTTSETSFVATTTRTTLPGDVLRRGAAQATPAAQYDKRLISPNVIRSSRQAVSSACSCIVTRPVQRTRTTTRSVTFTTTLRPTSTQTIRTTVTTVLPQGSTTVTRQTLITSTAPTALSLTLTTLTTPSLSFTSTTTISPLIVPQLSTDRTQTTTTSQTTSTKTVTATVEATQTLNVPYADRCGVKGDTPDVSKRILDVAASEAACGNECVHSTSGCKSWVWQSDFGICYHFSASLGRIGFAASETGERMGWDVGCTVPAGPPKIEVECFRNGYGSIPTPLVEPFPVFGSTQLQQCSDACWNRLGCSSYKVDINLRTCTLYPTSVRSYLTEDGFKQPDYFDRLCLPPPDECSIEGRTSIGGQQQPDFTSRSTCASACRANERCTSYSFQGNFNSGTRICTFYTVKVRQLEVQPLAPNAPTTSPPTIFADRDCTLPVPEEVPCNTPAYAVRPADSSLQSITLQTCASECNTRTRCLSFLYQSTQRTCFFFTQPADAAMMRDASAVGSSAFRRDCPTPVVQRCSALGDIPARGTTPLARVGGVSSFYNCALQCQSRDDCLSFWYGGGSQSSSDSGCTLFATSAEDAGFSSNSAAAIRWSDKSCGLPSASQCDVKASNLPVNSDVFRNERTLSTGLDNASHCDALCRRDELCRSWSFATNGGSTTCRTYTAPVQGLAGIAPNPSGSISFSDVTDCARQQLDESTLSLLCASPPAARFYDLAASDRFPINANTNLPACRSFCQQTPDCKSYSGLELNGDYVCFVWRGRAVLGLVTAGHLFNTDLAFPAYYDRACPA